MKISKKEAKEFVLGDEKDIEILKKAKQLEKANLNAEDRELVALIKTQLRKDWRTPLLEKLKGLAKKYPK